MGDLVYGWDATHANLARVPAGQGFGYTTGSADIRWDEADWDAHPGAVRCDQDGAASDSTADVLDDETNAATDSDVPDWTDRAIADFKAGTRPGQRWPCVYKSLSGIPALLDKLNGRKVADDPKLHVADWSLTMDQAAAMVGTTIGGLEVVAVQFANRGSYDSDVWDSDWLTAVSGAPPPLPPPPPLNWTEKIMQELPEIKLGSTGSAVRTAQGLLVARYFDLGVTGTRHDGIDGSFGPLTESAVKDAQGRAGILADGIVGPKTWPILAGV